MAEAESPEEAEAHTLRYQLRQRWAKPLMQPPKSCLRAALAKPSIMRLLAKGRVNSICPIIYIMLSHAFRM